MNSKNVYIAAGALAVVGIGAFAFLIVSEGQSSPTRVAQQPKLIESAKRQAQPTLELQPSRSRSLVKKSSTQSAQAIAGDQSGDNSQLVMTDVTDVTASTWVQSMYDVAYVYEGPVPTKAELEKREQERIGVHTEASMREKEEALAEALPEMRGEVDEARQAREAEQARFEKVGVSPEEKAARDGVQLEQ